MISWISDNIGTLLAALILIAVICSIIYVIKKDKKKGKSSCGCGCAHCAMADTCHKDYK